MTRSASNVTFFTGETIDPQTPTVDGFVDSWSVNPALPSGLSLDPGDGTISGAPTTAQPTQAFTVTADLTDTDSVQQMADRVSSHYHRVDVLANVAGGFSMGPPLHETPDETWDFMLNLNARSVFNTCRAVIPGMLSHGGGRIVNVAARAALEGKAKMGPYCASKAAVITLTQSLAAEHKLNGINANCILPGTIDTPQNRADMPNADFSMPTCAVKCRWRSAITSSLRTTTRSPRRSSVAWTGSRFHTHSSCRTSTPRCGSTTPVCR